MSMGRTLPDGRIAEISVFCRELRNMDTFSKSDPFVVLFVHPSPVSPASIESMRQFRSRCVEESQRNLQRESTVHVENPQDWMYAGETEVVWDDLNPAFVGKFYLPYDTDAQRGARLRFEVYDMDKEDDSLKKQDFLGAVECTLPQIVEVRPRRHTMTLCDKSLRPRPKYGRLIAAADVYTVQRPQHLIDIKTVFCVGNEMPHQEQVFFVISRKVKHIVDGDEQLWVRVHRSGALAPPPNHGTREYSFQDVTLTEEQLTAGDLERKLRLELYIFRSNGAHLLIGWTSSFSYSALQTRKDNGLYHFIPATDSGAGLQRGEVTVNTQIARQRRHSSVSDSSTPSFLSGSSLGELEQWHSLRGLETSVIIFRFTKFAWNQSLIRKRSSLLSRFRGHLSIN